MLQQFTVGVLEFRFFEQICRLFIASEDCQHLDQVRGYLMVGKQFVGDFKLFECGLVVTLLV